MSDDLRKEIWSQAMSTKESANKYTAKLFQNKWLVAGLVTLLTALLLWLTHPPIVKEKRDNIRTQYVSLPKFIGWSLLPAALVLLWDPATKMWHRYRS